MLQGKLFSLLHLLVNHVAKAGSDLLNGVAPDTFHALVLKIQDGGGVAALWIESNVNAEQKNRVSHVSLGNLQAFSSFTPGLSRGRKFSPSFLSQQKSGYIS